MKSNECFIRRRQLTNQGLTRKMYKFQVTQGKRDNNKKKL